MTHVRTTGIGSCRDTFLYPALPLPAAAANDGIRS